MTLTFEHILKQLLNESTTTAANISSFIDLLLDYYLKLTLDQSKKHLSDDLFKQIQQRQSSFLQLVSFVIPYDKNKRLASQFHCIIQSLIRRIDKEDLSYVRYQMQIISTLLSSKTLSDLSNEFYDLIIRKLLDCASQSDTHVWIHSMKQMLTILSLNQSNQISVNDVTMKFLRSLADRIQWPLDSLGDHSKLHDRSWRSIFVRMLATMNALLTHRVQQLESRHGLSMKKPAKENGHSSTQNGHHEQPDGHGQDSSLVQTQPFFDDDDEHQGEMHEEMTFVKQQHSDLSHLEQELLSMDSLFSTVEKWIETVSVRSSSIQYSSHSSSILQFIHEDHSMYDENLVLTSIQTCTRLMYVSPVLCSKYVDRIFDLSKLSSYSSVRSALIVSLGDLLLR